MAQSTEKIDVLDKGFVRLIDFMGGDDRAVQAARVSFGAVSKGPEQDKRLIKYLMEHAHHTPFEHCYFQFHICCPIYVARQWMRHRWGSYNEVSARYTEVKDEFYIPASFRGQDTKNKQGSVDSASLDQTALRKIYEDSIELPVCQYTQFYWSVNARSLFNFLCLRTDKHAQYEIRVYADVIAKIVQEKMPWAWEAFEALNKQLPLGAA